MEVNSFLMLLDTKFHAVQEFYILFLIKQMDILEKMAELNISLFYSDKKNTKVFDRIRYLIM